MTYAKFRELLKAGETATVDFKIQCDAFASGGDVAKAELAKDICAMANNGNVSSHIVIGVSDDRCSCQSVTNTRLTDDNLQDFCKTAVSPPPKVRVHRERWPEASGPHAGKEFVIIQVGPQPRQAFCLGRDFMLYPKMVCYRRNEVWIRRGATSDLASPAEVARLVRGRSPYEQGASEGNTVYAKLPVVKQNESLMNDLGNLAAELGIDLVSDRLVARIGGLRHVWHVVALDDCTRKQSLWNAVARSWAYEHGCLLLVRGSVSQQAFLEKPYMHFKAGWGYLTQYALRRHFGNYRGFVTGFKLPQNTDPSHVSILAIPNVKDTNSLRDAVTMMLHSLESDPVLQSAVRTARDTMNDNLRRWLRQGWLMPSTGRILPGKVSRLTLSEDEVYDRQSSRVLRRDRDPELMRHAQYLLDLSAGRR